MTLYITPFGRVARRRTWTQPYRDEEETNTAYDVFVPVNVQAAEEEYVITALLLGVKSEDLNIQVVNETVTLQGELKGTASDKDNFMVREIPTGRFFRTIRLPEPLDINKAAADLTDGVLTLRVPKAEEARPRMIKVNAN